MGTWKEETSGSKGGVSSSHVPSFLSHHMAMERTREQFYHACSGRMDVRTIAMQPLLAPSELTRKEE